MIGILSQFDKRAESMCRGLLDILYEWCSISQSAAERVMIFVYMGINIAADSWVKRVNFATYVIDAVLDVVLFITMWRMHRIPSVLRQHLFVSESVRSLRIVVALFLLTLPFPIVLLHNWPYFVLSLVRQIVFVVFWYFINISSSGERGRKRKLAMEEIKKLFGELTWIPKPLPE